ncbi:MAG TPA: ABC transporter ATP-binding protein, partial [Kofleriaceae bacterium]|nr:ABC transporter ATP-binding protein [Kofleriaceae bacterium]
MTADADAGDALVVEGVTRRYGARVALDDVGFAVGAGRLCALVGANGAGKTTLLRIIGGFLDADRGRVAIEGIDVAAAPEEAAARRGFLAEGTPLPAELTVAEYLDHRARLRGLGRAARRAELDRRLAEVELGDRRRDPIGRLSKGLRQRVGLADALLGDPPLVVLDEPGAGLDEEQRGELRGRLRAVAGVRAVLWSTHELADAAASADQVVGLGDGRVLAAGAPAAVIAAAGGGGRAAAV